MLGDTPSWGDIFVSEQLVLAKKHFQQISNHQQKHSVVGPLSKVNSIHHTHHMGRESQLLRHHNFVWPNHVTTKGTTAERLTPQMHLKRSESYGWTLGAVRNGLTKSDEMSWALGVSLNEIRAAYYWKALDSWAKEKIPYGNRKLHAESERDVKWIYVIHTHVMYVNYR